MCENKIAVLNDRVRCECEWRYQIIFSEGFGNMCFTRGVIDMIRDFDDFNENNDPYWEHDFWAIEYRGKKIFWKFDYFDNDLKYASPDPSDENQTIRVLTIMLAEEY